MRAQRESGVVLPRDDARAFGSRGQDGVETHHPRAAVSGDARDRLGEREERGAGARSSVRMTLRPGWAAARPSSAVASRASADPRVASSIAPLAVRRGPTPRNPRRGVRRRPDWARAPPVSETLRDDRALRQIRGTVGGEIAGDRGVLRRQAIRAIAPSQVQVVGRREGRARVLAALVRRVAWGSESGRGRTEIARRQREGQIAGHREVEAVDARERSEVGVGVREEEDRLLEGGQSREPLDGGLGRGAPRRRIDDGISGSRAIVAPVPAIASSARVSSPEGAVSAASRAASRMPDSVPPS